MRIPAAFLLSCVLSTLPAAAIAGNDRGDRDRRSDKVTTRYNVLDDGPGQIDLPDKPV